MADNERKRGDEDSNDGSRRDPGSDKVKLFISYSHGPESHQEWVKELAKRLESDGIEVVFDQEDLRIGMSPSIWFEEKLKYCDRVLLVITEDYVTKSKNLAGGVAYERMIITAEIAKDLRTTRFIPLLRSGDEWPVFLGDRLRIDARDDAKWEKSYQKLLAELLRPLERAKNEPEQNEPAKAAEPKPEAKKPESQAKPGLEEGYHWSHDVHALVGNRLYLILIKFMSTGEDSTASIVKNVLDACISDYDTYELYASHDLLVRAWANQDSFYRLRENILSNKEIDGRHTEVMEAHSIRHFPDGNADRRRQDAEELAYQLSAGMIDDIQNGAINNEEVERLIDHGVRIPDSVRFHKDRIQFYIIVRALKHDITVIDKFEVRAKSFTNIHNKTIYRTIGNASEAVIKGQVGQDRYYDINEFVNAVTDALDHGDIRTETALVAQQGPRGNGRIDTRAAERHLIERKYRKLIGGGHRLNPLEDMTLLVRFAEAEPAMAEDREGVLKEMIRLRAQGESDNFNHIRTFLAEFEHLLRQNLNLVIAKLFTSKYEEKKRDLFTREKIADFNAKHLTLGDLTRVYRRLVEDNGIIPLHPLTEEEFNGLMAESVQIRNKLAHGVPEVTFWDNTFQFFKGFVRIESRLRKYIDSIG